jgi:hypothetical protein
MKALMLPRYLAEERVKQGKAKRVGAPLKNHGAAVVHTLPSPERRIGATESSWVSDLSESQHCVILCHLCTHKFDHEKYHYYKDRKFDYITGDCDGCRTKYTRAAIYFHQSVLTDPGGRTKSGQSWTPR